MLCLFKQPSQAVQCRKYLKAQSEVLFLAHRFIGMKFKEVRFEHSLFEDCYFEDVTSSETFFENCTIISTVFYNTGNGIPAVISSPFLVVRHCFIRF